MERTDVKTIFSADTGYDGKHIANLSTAVVPDETLRRIENGCPLEELEDIGRDYPICKYATQITIHGRFGKVATGRIGGYKNIFRNKNGSVGIRWEAIDNDKKRELFGILNACGEWCVLHNSTAYVAELLKAVHTQAEYDAVTKKFAEMASRIDKSLFIGTVEVTSYCSYGRVFVALQLGIRAFKMENMMKIACNVLGMSENEIAERIALKEEEKRRKELEWKERMRESEERAKAKREECRAYNERWMAENPPPYAGVKDHTPAAGDIYAVVEYERDKCVRWAYRTIRKAFGRLCEYRCDENGKIDRSRKGRAVDKWFRRDIWYLKK